MRELLVDVHERVACDAHVGDGDGDGQELDGGDQAEEPRAAVRRDSVLAPEQRRVRALQRRCAVGVHVAVEGAEDAFACIRREKVGEVPLAQDVLGFGRELAHALHRDFGGRLDVGECKTQIRGVALLLRLEFVRFRLDLVRSVEKLEMDAGVLVPLFDKLDQPVDHLLAREEQGREARAQIECEDGLHPVEQAMCVLRRRLGAQRARRRVYGCVSVADGGDCRSDLLGGRGRFDAPQHHSDRVGVLACLVEDGMQSDAVFELLPLFRVVDHAHNV
mmetsp:Transcript_51866/g.112929  ORF Transcript_51866/g.112929 Transcript_51866/m.112929 type:complete len:276 (-) Transcript_51866:1609-2436(-)